MRKLFGYIILILSLITNQSFGQKNHSVDFYIISNEGEAVSNAHISINDNRKLVTNYGGIASSSLETGAYEVSVSHISYSPYSERVNISRDTFIYLTLSSRTLETVEISARKAGKINQLSEINVDNLKEIPGITGNKDIIRSLTFLPGVSPTSEGNINFSVRGGESYQNSILIDRSQAYNINHLFGLLSTINSDIVNDVQLYKNHIPARFGNAGSSVLDISILRGNNQKLKHKVDIGLTNLSYNLNGPIIKDKLHFNFSVRSAFLGVLTSPLYLLYEFGNVEGYSNYNLLDNNFKISYSPTKKDRLSFHYYSSRDNLFSKGKSSFDSENRTAYGWNNRALNVSYYRKLKNGWFLNNFLNYSAFSTKLKNSSRDFSAEEPIITGFERINEYNNLNVQVEINKSFDRSVFRFGLHNDFAWFNPLKLVNTIGSEQAVSKVNLFTLNSLGLFTDNDFQLTSKFKLNAGFRLSIYRNESLSQIVPEPRFSAKYEINANHFIEASYNRLSQSKVQYPIVNFGLPLEIWIPTSEEVLPPVVSQFNLSYVANELFSKNLNLTSSIYYKRFDNLTTLQSVLPFFVEFDDNYQQYLFRNGRGEAYGFELGVEYSNDILNAFAGYHLSKSFRQFAEINKGEMFPFAFNRTHELNSYLDIKLSKRWRFTGSFNFSTGAPVTLPNAYIELDEDFTLYLFEERNNYRTPIYHRSDIAFTHKKITKRDRIRKWTFSVYNVYYQRNPYDASVSFDSNGDVNINYISVFPIIPSFLYSLQF